MARYIATVQYQDGQYWISFPDGEKAYSLADRPEDIVPPCPPVLESMVGRRCLTSCLPR